MITAKFCAIKLPENVKKDLKEVRKNLHSWITFDSVKIVSEEDDYKAILYDGVSEDPEEIYLSHFGYVFLDEFGKFTISELIEAYNVLTGSKSFYNKIVDANDLHRMLHTISCESVDNECLEKILGKKQAKKNNTKKNTKIENNSEEEDDENEKK